MNFIRMAQKLSKFFTNQKGASDVLELLTRDKKHNGFFSVVKPLDGIKLAFLINGINKGLDIETMLVEIENNLVSFSIVEFREYATKDTCDSCAGDGSIICDYCDGTGNITTDDEDGYDEDCDYCDGNGYDNCETCDGVGEVEDDSSTDYMIKTYVTFDSKIIEDITLLDSDTTEITNESLRLSLMNPKLIYLSMEDRHGGGLGIDEDYWGNSYINEIDYENDPNTYVRSNSITINRSIQNLSVQFRG